MNSCQSQVDKHIRRLDSDLARFEAEIKEKARVNAKVAEVEGTTTGKSITVKMIIIVFS